MVKMDQKYYIRAVDGRMERGFKLIKESPKKSKQMKNIASLQQILEVSGRMESGLTGDINLAH